MGTKLNPYINFKDNTRAAMEFYQSVFGGKLTMSTFKEFQASKNASDDEKIMHSELEAENGLGFMAADTPIHLDYRPGTNFSMSLSGENQAELTAYFEKLAVGGTITEPLTQAPWGDTFGMLIDQFGIAWLVNIAGKKE